MSRRTTVFVSYSHRDQRWLQRLQIHLKPFGRRGEIVLWDDTRMDAGEQWRSSIRDAIARAAASILLVSADFLASDFVASEELPPLLRRAETAGARVIPIVVQPCHLVNHPELARFQTLNPPNQPLSKLSDAEAEEVFVKAAEEVEKVLRAPQRAVVGVAHDPHGPDAHLEETSAGIFGELEAATMALSVLFTLAARQPRAGDYTLTELTRAMAAGSRKLSYETADRLARAGWITKQRVSGRTEYRISDEGLRQLQRLAAVADGPVRSAVAAR